MGTSFYKIIWLIDCLFTIQVNEDWTDPKFIGAIVLNYKIEFCIIYYILV